MKRRLSMHILVIAGAAGLAACGPPRSTGPAPESANSAQPSAPDAGLAAVAPTRRGLMVPSDTGMGAGSTGSTTTTGTNGKAVGPTLGNTSNGN
jgi:hypothetical protein